MLFKAKNGKKWEISWNYEELLLFSKKFNL